MHEDDGQNSGFTDEDDIQITNLGLPDSLLQRQAVRVIGLAHKGLATSWIRYGLSGALLLILLGALILQWPRPAPARPPAISKAASYFVSATTAQGFIFIQNNDRTLAAYQLTTGHLRWHTTLPALATIDAVNQMLYCYFVTAANKTELEALDANTGRAIWHDALPAASPSVAIAEFEIFGLHGPQGAAFLYRDNTIYIQSVNDTIYAIGASNGQINWTYQPANTGTTTPTPGTYYFQQTTLEVQNGIAEFISADSIIHILDASTGREVVRMPASEDAFLPTIEGQVLYLLPPPGPGAPAVQAFHIPDGQHLWTYPLSKGVYAQTETDGVVYLDAQADATVIALRGSDGRQLWSYHASDDQPLLLDIESSTTYLLQRDSTMVAIRGSDGQILWRSRISKFQASISQTTELFLDNGVLLLFDQQSLSPFPMYALSASDGQILWHGLMPTGWLLLLAGSLSIMQNNGQLDVWRESNGQHLWSYSAPVDSHILWNPRTTSTLIFLLDDTSTFYTLRASDGKQLWHYP